MFNVLGAPVAIEAQVLAEGLVSMARALPELSPWRVKTREPHSGVAKLSDSKSISRTGSGKVGAIAYLSTTYTC